MVDLKLMQSKNNNNTRELDKVQRNLRHVKNDIDECKLDILFFGIGALIASLIMLSTLIYVNVFAITNHSTIYFIFTYLICIVGIIVGIHTVIITRKELSNLKLKQETLINEKQNLVKK